MWACFRMCLRKTLHEVTTMGVGRIAITDTGHLVHKVKGAVYLHGPATTGGIGEMSHTRGTRVMGGAYLRMTSGIKWEFTTMGIIAVDPVVIAANTPTGVRAAEVVSFAIHTTREKNWVGGLVATCGLTPSGLFLGKVSVFVEETTFIEVIDVLIIRTAGQD